MAKALDDLRRISRDAQEAVTSALGPDEIVRVVLEGTHGTGMVGTDQRVLVWKKRGLNAYPYAYVGELARNYSVLLSWAQVRGPSVGTIAPALATVASLPDAVQLASGQKESCEALAALVENHQLPGGPQANPAVASSTQTRSSRMPGVDDGLVMEAEGNGGHLWLFEDFVRIKHFGMRGFVTQGFQKGDKEIPLDQITAIQWRDPGSMWLGHIQFTIVGGTSDTKKASQDENAVMFDKTREPSFRVMKEEIDRRRRTLRAPVPVPSAAPVPDVPDQIRKLAELRDLGILTAEEFEAKKGDLLARM